MDNKLSVAELDVSYTIMGDGAPVVILHGWDSSRRAWAEPQAILAENYRVYVPDLPGFGDTPPPAMPWGVSDYALFVSELLKAWELSSVYLIGHSFGGRIAIKWANGQMSKWANGQMGKWANGQMGKWANGRMGKWADLQICRLVLCASAGIKPPRTWKHKIFGAAAKAGKAVLGDNDAARRWLYFLVRERNYYRARGVMRETLSRVVGEDLRPLLSGIALPTLLVWGDADKMTPIGDAYIMRDEIAGARLEIVAGAGHRLPYERPREFCAIVKKFFIP